MFTDTSNNVWFVDNMLMLEYLFGVHRDGIGVACLALFDLDLS